MSNKTFKGIRVIWAVLCQSASIDQQTNTVSLFNIIEQINLNQSVPNPTTTPSPNELKDFPEKTIIPINATLVIQMERNDELTSSAVIKVEISDPLGEVLGVNEFPVEAIVNENKKLRAIVNIAGFPATRSGDYTFTILTKIGSHGKFEKQYSTNLSVNIYA